MGDSCIMGYYPPYTKEGFVYTNIDNNMSLYMSI